MGASNVAAAYTLYAGKVPATSMQVLIYMALVSKDNDESPWFSRGREALAEHALGRPVPFGRADARAVERAIEPLLSSGAITTDRRAAVRREGNSTARYRLNLRLVDAPRNPWGVESAHAPRKPWGVKGDEDPPRPTETVTDAPRKTSSRPTVSVLTPHENRGPEEQEDLFRSEEEEEMAGVTTASPPPRVITPSKAAPVIQLFSKRPTSRADEAIAEAAARRAKAVADHQARLAAEEIS